MTIFDDDSNIAWTCKQSLCAKEIRKFAEWEDTSRLYSESEDIRLFDDQSPHSQECGESNFATRFSL